MTTQQRLDRLERQNGRLKRGMIGMAVAVLSLLVMGQTLPPKVHDVVRAKKFWVIGNDGRTMVRIGSDRRSGWVFVDGKKKAVVGISADDRGNGRISLQSLKGKEVAYIGANKEGDGLVGINDSAGRRLIWVGADQNGEGIVVQFNRAGKQKAVWPPLR